MASALDRSKLNAAFVAQAAAERVLDQRQTALKEAKETAARFTNQQAETEKNPPALASFPRFGSIKTRKTNG